MGTVLTQRLLDAAVAAGQLQVGGQVLRVGDIAAVREYFVDEQYRTRFRTPTGSGPSAGAMGSPSSSATRVTNSLPCSTVLSMWALWASMTPSKVR